MNYTDVMVDLETLGPKPGCSILSIGAVAFNKGQPEKEWATFDSGPIDRVSCKTYGLVEDKATLDWWATQPPAARKLLEDCLMPKAIDVFDALRLFGNWFPAGPSALWGNGNDFDNVILGAVFDAAGLIRPWGPFNGRCFRTMKSTFTKVPKPKATGLKHSALDDALNQTRHLQLIFKHLRIVL